MNNKVLTDRITGANFVDTPEDHAHIQKVRKLAAGGALPYAVRESMKAHGWHMLSQDSNDETAKLLIAYSWWARALEGGLSKSKFVEYMNDHLKYLDARCAGDKEAEAIIQKWKPSQD